MLMVKIKNKNLPKNGEIFLYILPIDNPKTSWYNRPARERTWRAEFLSRGGLHKFLGQIFVHNVNRQNPELVLYYNHSKGRKTQTNRKGIIT